MSLYDKASRLSSRIYGMEFADTVARDALCALADLCEEIAAAVVELEKERESK